MEIIKQRKKARGKKFVLILVLIIILVVFTGVVGMQQFIKMKKAEYAENMPEMVSLVTAMKIESTQWIPTIKATGKIRPNQGAMLSAQMSGAVKDVLIKSGQQVTKGQLLVEIDSTVEKANLKAAEAQLPQAKKNYQRYQSLIKSGSASKAEYDNIKATYNQLVANIEALKASIKRRQIYAPFDGVVGIVKVNQGQYVSMGTPIVRVEDRSAMKVQFSLPQMDLSKVKLGQDVVVTTDVLANQSFPAKIIAIDPAVNTATGLVELEAVITSGQQQLLSGMFVNLNIQLPAESDQVVIPQIAVTYTMYGETVYILQPLSEQDKTMIEKMKAHNPTLNVDKMYRVKQVEVKTLDRNGNFAQLAKRKNLKVNDMLVTGGFQRLSDNALVTVAEKKGVGETAPSTTGNL
ncbi:efflux RND transporter periplasmic adaptor subunit [Phocoenobacter skyensis]|uniref:Efflux RND transporter periplasmic adaptor subunit n=1 Tax=Phocoenobacter skyensis TaxID=97481 RepID=A0A1H7WDP7_9PAST|nr:efflux RND transporter periplasmic adaptor subunit [Pasteurella skyensis]MDP8079185.1 efflux RND transporter periplasmic adaptor subunit [Pasteurella skyensis]MDP8085205.1 efflux RND transporter periplasmic adaptor subunit [Pasteurella skyensis]MDP8162169.1 efflux RND transporter periplasmic adaptor subunit [Pasteurella skyensis]MDP8169994.1 efflux RND transporter periplasmic adaptor subunit [Pasteurella skyensis]MDP8173028.1 efflux RND transporter periplasmic adaptor subunit [Pasteurella s